MDDINALQQEARDLLDSYDRYEDMNLVDKQKFFDLSNKHQLMYKRWVQQEQELAGFINKLNQTRPLTERELEVMCYDALQKMSTYRSMQIVDIWLDRKNGKFLY